MKKAILVATIGAMTLGVNAGDWGKAPVGKAPIEECVDLGGSITAGWMSDYYYHGVYNFADVVWTDVNYTFDGLAVPVTVGVAYFNSVRDNHGDQLDVYANADLGTFAGFDTNLGYTYHWFNEGTPTDEFGEVSLNLRRSLGFADLVIGTNYMMGDEGNASHDWYHSIGLEKTIGLTDNISLVLAGGAGYLDGTIDLDQDSVTTSAWNHYYLRASLPIQLNCRSSLTPYVGYHREDGAIDNRSDHSDDELHYGVSLNVTF